jgi:hypothetical protein
MGVGIVADERVRGGSKPVANQAALPLVLEPADEIFVGCREGHRGRPRLVPASAGRQSYAAIQIERLYATVSDVDCRYPTRVYRRGFAARYNLKNRHRKVASVRLARLSIVCHTF